MYLRKIPTPFIVLILVLASLQAAAEKTLNGSAYDWIDQIIKFLQAIDTTELSVTVASIIAVVILLLKIFKRKSKKERKLGKLLRFKKKE